MLQHHHNLENLRFQMTRELHLHLLSLQLVLAARFFASVRAYLHGTSTGEWLLPQLAPRRCGAATRAPILPRQLELRVAFLTRRFAPHAPFWQLAIWARQFALFAIGMVSRVAMRYTTSAADAQALRFSLAALAGLTIVGAWALHERHRPFA